MGLLGCADDAAPRHDAGSGGPERPLLVLAASGLVLAMDALVEAFEARSGVEVTPVYGSSGNLAAQIGAGAPADLFFAADDVFVDRLIEQGLVDPTSRTVYALGRLVLVVPEGRPLPAGVGSLADRRYAVVAIANPDHAPYGRAAREALASAGVLPRVEPRLVYGDNVQHTLQFVRTGNADAGLVALALLPPDARGPHVMVEHGLHEPIRQVAGMVRATARPDEARAFLSFVGSAEGRAILSRFGFDAGRDS